MERAEGLLGIQIDKVVIEENKEGNLD